jgi:hypothetical protein
MATSNCGAALAAIVFGGGEAVVSWANNKLLDAATIVVALRISLVML